MYGTYIFLLIYRKNQPNLGKYYIPYIKCLVWNIEISNPPHLPQAQQLRFFRSALGSCGTQNGGRPKMIPQRGLEYPLGSMGCLVYLPTFKVDFYSKMARKYTRQSHGSYGFFCL